MSFSHGQFKPMNPGKYVGVQPIFFRSSWELKLMRMLDAHPNIINWASESVKIPYINPFTNKYSVYIPDFLIIYDDKDGKRIAEIVEVKPMKETLLTEARGDKDKASVALNAYKWKAATEWAKHHGMRFRVMSEHNLFDKPVRRR